VQLVFLFCLYLILHTSTATIRYDTFRILNFVSKLCLCLSKHLDTTQYQRHKSSLISLPSSRCGYRQSNGTYGNLLIGITGSTTDSWPGAGGVAAGQDGRGVHVGFLRKGRACWRTFRTCHTQLSRSRSDNPMHVHPAFVSHALPLPIHTYNERTATATRMCTRNFFPSGVGVLAIVKDRDALYIW
jgi:hypothetical protein